jgi:MFS family permease
MPPNRAVTVTSACLGVFVSYLPVVGVSTALPVIQQALGASTVGLQWITDAFILPTTALLLTFGITGDLLGRKRICVSGLCLTVLGCLVALSALVGAVLGVGIALAMAPITTIAVNSVPCSLAGTTGSANSALRQIGSALGPAIFGVILTQRTLSALPGHLAASGLSQADQGTVNGIVSNAGIQAGAFLRLSNAAVDRSGACRLRRRLHRRPAHLRARRRARGGRSGPGDAGRPRDAVAVAKRAGWPSRRRASAPPGRGERGVRRHGPAGDLLTVRMTSASAPATDRAGTRLRWPPSDLSPPWLKPR